MRVVLQRVREARVRVDGRTVGEIGRGPVNNPAEAEIPREQIDPIIAAALQDAAGASAKDVTPALLSRILELTGGQSLASNIALVLNNARLGAEIAREIATARANATK